jgi:short-subunit dehydrogenase
MQTKQTIAIIGASGNMGSAISKCLAKGNYRLLLCGNDQDKIQLLAQEIKMIHPTVDVENLNCTLTASWEANIIIMAVPYGAEREVASKILGIKNNYNWLADWKILHH